MSGLRFDGWVPFRLYWQGGEPGVEWLYMGQHRFSDPFFEETLHFEAQTPFNSLFRFRTPLAALEDWYAASPGIEPAGFVFHLSRCGSTLITRMLAEIPDHLVLSEVGVLDRLLRECARATWASLEQRAGWVRWLVSALGQRRTGLERRLFIKFDPRTIAELPLLRLAFPETPWIFVYRNPVEVLVSNLRLTSALLTRGFLGPEFLNFDAALVATMDDEYAARVLGIVGEHAVRQIESADGMPVEYRQLPDLVWGDLQRHFGLQLTVEQIERIKQAAQFDAKAPKQRFESDTEAKNREASERVRSFAAEWIGPHYKRLEDLRRARTAGFPALRKLLLADPETLAGLRGLERDTFFQAALGIAAQAGIRLKADDIERAISEARGERARRIL